MNRKKNLSTLNSKEFDICIIGAGASGAGAALDATLRGFKVILIDKGDFSSETSSKSTKLIHGGVRYLEQAFKNLDASQLNQVRHGLEERKTVINIASHLAKPIGLITPVFSWFEGVYYSIGLKLYGLFAKKDHFPKSRWLSKKETLERMPGLTPNLHSSVLYYDGTFDDARFALALVQSAAELGLCAINYARLTKFEKSETGELQSALINDETCANEYKIKAKLFLNCAGPFADQIRLMAESTADLRIQPSKGVHLVLPSSFLPGKDAMLIPETKDGRVVFVKPLGNKIMVGTTDSPYDLVEEEPCLENDELDYLLETLSPFLEKKVERKDVIAGFGGIRPLLAPKKSNSEETKALLRDHEVEHLKKSNLLSLMGGKWTTYRVMAKDAIDFACRLLNHKANCQTAQYKLIGNRNDSFDSNDFVQSALEQGLELTSINHLLEAIGDQSNLVLDIIKEENSMIKLIHPNYPFILAEVVYSIRNEMVINLRDFFARRIRLEIMDWKAVEKALEEVEYIYQKELGWSESVWEANKGDYIKQLHDFRHMALIKG